jgi:organic radical activating enzyme
MIRKSKFFIKNSVYKFRLKISDLEEKHSFLVVLRNIFVIARRLVMTVQSFFFTELNYLEFHITDHCNLNCNSCSHFSNIAIENYINIKEYEKDILQLSVLFHNIRVIRIMGGEPLLHPEVLSFIEVTRKIFPRSSIRLVTNGLLLLKASESFWNTCYNTNTIIYLSVYPPLINRVKEIELLCNANRVILFKSPVKEYFHSSINIRGDSDQKQRFIDCQKLYQAITLRNGHLFPCWMPSIVSFFNNKFDFNIDVDKGVDIYSSDISGRKIINHLNLSMETCKWCSNKHSLKAWDCGKINYENWVS